jgi:hypothetical protein
MTFPRIVKGGIVVIDVTSGRPLSVIALQYNPDTLSRNLAVQAAAGGSTDHSQALRLKGVAVQTVKLEVEIDATDSLEHPATNRDAVKYGIHPQLAVLEALVNPTAAALQANDTLSRSGVLEILPIQEPLTLFVWGKERVMPMRITELSITEEAFDAALNPIRAKVSLGMRALSVDDLGFDHRGGTLFMSHLRSRESMARRAKSAALSALGLEAV